MQRIFKTEFQDYTIKKSEIHDNIVLVYLNENLACIINYLNDEYNSSYFNEWMYFPYAHKRLEKKLLSDISTYIPAKNIITTCKNTLPARFRIYKNDIYFEIQINNKWLSTVSIGEYSKKFWLVNSGYTVNNFSIKEIIKYFKDEIHIKYFPQELVDWMKSQELVAKLLNL